MGWSVRKALLRAGAPVLVFLVGKVAIELVRGGYESSAFELIWINALLFGIIWLVAALIMFLVTRMMPNSL